MVRCKSFQLMTSFAALAVALLSGSQSEAGYLSIVNSSFEADVLPSEGYTLGAITGWAVTGTGGAVHTDASQYPAGPPDGVNVGWSNGGTISQALTSTLAAGSYTLTVDIGARADFAFGGYVVELLAGSTILAEDNNTLSPTAGTFSLSTVSYTALPSDSLLGQTLSVVLVGDGIGGGQSNFDKVQLFYNPTVVPEPASILSLVVGAGLCGLYARRRRKTA